MNLVVHHLRFLVRATTLVHLGPQAGAQIRGALWAALQQFACTAPNIEGDPGHAQHCPMCRLMALETGTSPRGANPPRPFAIRPPLVDRIEQDRVFYTGDGFTIGINLFGDAAGLFPYVCQAVYRMGEIGIGYGRGRFVLEQIDAVDPLSGETMSLFKDRRIIAIPDFPITQNAIEQAIKGMSTERVQLRFLTPIHLKHEGQRLNKPVFVALLARLLERCQALELHYTDEPGEQAAWREQYLMLTELAQHVQVMEDRTRWFNVQTGSRRTGSRNSISGFTGDAVFQGNLSPFLPWLLWGQSLHVGKNAVKGNGWYEVVPQ